MADLRENLLSYVLFFAWKIRLKAATNVMKPFVFSCEFAPRLGFDGCQLSHVNTATVAPNWTRLIGWGRCTERYRRLSSVVWVTASARRHALKTLIFALLPSNALLPSLCLSGEEERKKYLYWWVTFFPTRGCLTVIRAASCDLWKCDDACFYGTLQFYKDCLLPRVFVYRNTLLCKRKKKSLTERRARTNSSRRVFSASSYVHDEIFTFLTA